MMNDSSRQQQQQSGGRPQYHRGATAPIYQRRTDTHQSPHNDPMRLASLAGLSRIDESARAPALTASLPIADTIRRTLGASEVTSLTSSRALPLPQTTASHQGLFTPPQTPSSSSSSSSYSSSNPSTRGSTPRVMPSSSSGFTAGQQSLPMPSQTYFPLGAYQQQSPAPSWTPMAPSVSAASSSSITPAQLVRQSPQSEIKMEIETSPSSHTLLAPLGPKFSSDCLTIAAKKNNTLHIMADRWDLEENSHFEWLITLDRDADLSTVTATFSDGLLRVTVRRRTAAQPMPNGGGYRVAAAGYS